MTNRLFSIRFWGLILVFAIFSCLPLVGSDRLEAQGYPERIAMHTMPGLNYAGTVEGTWVTYVTSNGYPRTVFIADGLERRFQEPVAVYLNTSELYKLYTQGVID